jgi:beta-aspartyl-peptidase (threonine type)
MARAGSARSDHPALAVHGGAGHERVAERAARRAGVVRAAEAGWAVLAAGGSALDAVIEAVVALENDPHFNAGFGSVLTEDGRVELDASVMEGTGLRAGAVGAVTSVANPVRLARAVLDEGREVLLVGAPAATLARRHGLPRVAAEALVTPAARLRWEQRGEASGETVGAVARDARGGVAAATSTGGLAGKRRGRVGDSAVIGAGTYADDRVGAGSATGPGEAIIRIGLVRVALDQLAAARSATAAARSALAVLQARLGASAGLVLTDARGRLGVARTTPSMPVAVRRAGAARALLVD